MEKEEINFLKGKIVSFLHASKEKNDSKRLKVNEIWFVDDITDSELLLLNVGTGYEKTLPLVNVEERQGKGSTKVILENGITFKIKEDHYTLVLNRYDTVV